MQRSQVLESFSLRLSKKIPEFKSEDEERSFWQEHDSAEFLDWSKAERLEKELGAHRTAEMRHQQPDEGSGGIFNQELKFARQLK